MGLRGCSHWWVLCIVALLAAGRSTAQQKLSSEPELLPAAVQFPKIDAPSLPGPGGTVPTQVVRDALERLPVGSSVTLPEAATQVIRFGPRYGVLNNAKSEPVPGEKDVQRITYLGGLNIDVTYEAGANGPARKVQFAADHVVIWVSGVKTGVNLNDGLRVDAPKKGEKGEETKTKAEFYLSGNVVIRFRSDETSQGVAEQVLRADEVYYEVERSRAIAVKADLQTNFPTGLDSIHMKAEEMWRLGVHEFRGLDTTIFSSKRPADPSLTIRSQQATIIEQNVVKTNIFGRPYRNARTGEPDMGYERILTSEENTVRLLGIPISYFKDYKTEISEPLGPLTGIGLRSDRVYGPIQTYSSWDMFKLLGLRGQPGNTWQLHLDYLSLRGPGAGTDFVYRDLFGSEFKNVGDFSVYGLFNDTGNDQLGGYRGPEPKHPAFRSRLIWSHNQDIYEEGTTYVRAMGQFAYLSDKNFMEQFYKNRHDTDPNQETFAYVYGARDNFAWSMLGNVNVNRPWVTETQWLPRADAALIGENFFDLLSYTTRASAGYARFRPADQAQTAKPILAGDQTAVNTLRGDWYQRASLPVDLGPFRLEPYGIMDVTAYSEDQTGKGRGRFFGAGGAKLSVPFSKLDAEMNNELLNVRGIYHKVEVGLNYYNAYTDTDPKTLPQLDRLNDDVSDYSFRAFRRFGGIYRAPGGDLFANTPAGQAVAFSPVFDQQDLANRRILQSRTDILNTMEVLQGEIRQRWQTKRGPEGNEHTVDWMALNLKASYYPNKNRDNYGESFGSLQYDYLWNIGDRTAITSSGWFETHQLGTKFFQAGIHFNRTDGSNFYFGYRHTDPLGSRLLVAVFGYQFSQKYSVSVINAYDLSNNFSQTSSIAFNRTGTDMTMSLGVSYNAFQNNLGLQFLLVPNAALFGRSGSIGNLFLQ